MGNLNKRGKVAKESTVYTPDYLSEYIFNLINEKYDYKKKIILDPCIGKGSLTKPFFENGSYVVGNDIEAT